MHTLTHGTTTIPLDTGMLWEDEFTWLPAVSNARRAVDGTLLIEASALPSGRPITLTGGEDHGWISRATVNGLRALLGVAGQAMTLTLDDGRVFAVAAVPGEPALEARMVMAFGRPVDLDFYIATVRLIAT